MKKVLIALCLLCMFSFVAETEAQRPVRRTVKVKKVHRAGPRRAKTVRVTTVRRYPRSKVVVVKRRPVRTVTVLPAGYTTIVYRNVNYYHHAGYFYNYNNNQYVYIAPPRGIRINVLPVGYRTVIYGGVTRYYYHGVYYSQVENAYETADPAVGTVVPELPTEDVEEVSIDGKTYYEYDDILYKTIVTKEGNQYEVVGRLDD
jgi:hypothetical protein